MTSTSSLAQLGSNLWVMPGHIISIAPRGGEDGGPEPGEFHINVRMPTSSGDEWVASYESDWPMPQVIQALQDFNAEAMARFLEERTR